MTKSVLLAADLDPARSYLILTSLIVPRPVAWISTVSAEGIANLAPHSLVTVASGNPPVVVFTSLGEKDTVRNARATGKFTLSVVSESTWQAANATSWPYGPEIDEFSANRIVSEPGDAVDVPRPAASLAHMECTVRQIMPVGNSFLVLGDVQAFVLDDSALDETGRPSAAALAPVAKLGADDWCHAGGLFVEPRPMRQP